MKKGIIFDMDGTIWNSSETVAKAWTEVLQEAGDRDKVLTAKDMKAVMGKTMDEIAEIFFPNLDRKKRQEMLDICCGREQSYLIQQGAKLYAGLEETLKKLQKSYPLYIVSNCQAGYIEAFLEHYQFSHYFEDFECFGVTKMNKDKNIRLVMERNQLDDAVYVGDIQGDYDSSCKAGVPFIHAAYGFGSINAEVPAIQSLSELPEVVKTVFS